MLEKSELYKPYKPNFQLGHIFIVRVRGKIFPRAVVAEQADVSPGHELNFYDAEGCLLTSFDAGEWVSFTNA